MMTSIVEAVSYVAHTKANSTINGSFLWNLTCGPMGFKIVNKYPQLAWLRTIESELLRMLEFNVKVFKIAKQDWFWQMQEVLDRMK